MLPHGIVQWSHGHRGNNGLIHITLDLLGEHHLPLTQVLRGKLGKLFSKRRSPCSLWRLTPCWQPAISPRQTVR